MPDPGIFIAFLAGVLSIASPCILPILPSFLGYIGGVSLSPRYADLTKKQAHRKLMINTFLFSVGFSIVFLLFGAVIGLIGQTLLLNRPIFQQIGGILLIIFGLQLTGIIQLKIFLKERKINLPKFLAQPSHRLEYLRSFLIGVLFAFSWAPCYGPIIGSIFTLAAVNSTFAQSILLFVFYSLGFLVPLLLFTFFIGHISHFIKKYHRIARYACIVSGALVIFLGIMLITNNAAPLMNWLSSFYIKSGFPLL